MTMYPVEFFTTYHTISTEPEWSRSERLGYCEPFRAEKGAELTGLKKLLISLFG
ncbi:MAG: hypothetical protein K6E30_05850 [Lachnospiraceae bacterium]|nr:hypothetical protein [Lachnospiraceae bacterium]